MAFVTDATKDTNAFWRSGIKPRIKDDEDKTYRSAFGCHFQYRFGDQGLDHASRLNCRPAEGESMLGVSDAQEGQTVLMS